MVGTLVTITGTNFQSSDGTLAVTAVYFGTVSAIFAVTSATTIVAIAPQGVMGGTAGQNTGTVDITVVNAAGTSATSANDKYALENQIGTTDITPLSVTSPLIMASVALSAPVITGGTITGSTIKATSALEGPIEITDDSNGSVIGSIGGHNDVIFVGQNPFLEMLATPLHIYGAPVQINGDPVVGAVSQQASGSGSLTSTSYVAICSITVNEAGTYLVSGQAFFTRAGGSPTRTILIKNDTQNISYLSAQSGPTPSVNPNETQLCCTQYPFALNAGDVVTLRAKTDTTTDTVTLNATSSGVLATYLNITRTQ